MKLIQELEIINWFKTQPKNHILTLGLSILWLCLLSWLAFFCNLGNIGLIDETEPLFAEAARQMVETGDWITPYFNGETRFDKPPLIYWLMAIAYHLFGINEWSVRLPSAISATALMCFGFYILYRYGYYQLNSQINPKNKFLMVRLLIAWIGAAMIALNPETIAWGRIGVSDMLLTGCMCSALFAFFMGYASQTENTHIPQQKNSKILRQNVSSAPDKNQSSKTTKLPIFNKWYLTFYILISLAVLAKGPIGIVLPALIIGSFLLYVGNFFQIWQEINIRPGILIFSIITFPWYFLVTLVNGKEYLDSFFGHHNFERFTSVVNHHQAPWYFYFLVVLIGFAPWSIYLPVAIAKTKFWQLGYWRSQPRTQQLGLFAFFWFICIFIFFSISATKLPSYVLPLMPAAAILVGLFWSDIIINGDSLSSQTNKSENNSTQSSINPTVNEVRSEKSTHPSPLPGGDVRSDFCNEDLSNSPKTFPFKRRGFRPNYFDNSVEPVPKLERNTSQSKSRFLSFSVVANIIFLLILALGIIYSFNWLDRDPAMPYFPEIIRKSGLLIRGGLIFLATAIVIGFLWRKKQNSWIWSANFIGLVACLIFTINPMMFLVDQERQLPLRQLAQTIVEVRQPGEEIIMIAFEKPSLVFYTRQPVEFFRRATNAREYLEEIVQKDSSGNVVMIGYPKKFIHAGLQPGEYQYLDSRGAYQLGKVPKNLFMKESGAKKESGDRSQESE
ncbi:MULTISPECIES: glycosyltransferase family 39 protein [unclassified Okeania]|uniref:ArnT family glycosyltransferase n=1 Tax=unclassified Okeania TaxID=2634635 RepID=UPI0013B6754A|nr:MULTISPECIES: glycosyltransferase family 39 protein [unclassified Okeania]NES79246.1 glycosyltransferase family 39 protein [Okeania sp. SIO1H4]NET22954.1 glycosyltransferase family 39 protein [Okeania sp. SIO1H5]NET79320.1 glycosyltransferase family 39 protein [Okeania sp. SIO1F9]NET96388.1 glycosyltransferase family 39 protein [Okeania sp. SIO1H2]